MANPDEEAHAKSMNSLMDELHRCSQLGLTQLNIHPGSHLRKITPQEGCERVAMSINKALADSSETKSVIVF